MRLGRYIRAFREANRYGTREMAILMGISSATLNRIERGECVDQKTFLKLINYLMDTST